MTSGQMPNNQNFPGGENNPYQQAPQSFQQPEQKKPWYKNLKIIIPIILVIVVIAAVSGGSGDDTSSESSADAASTNAGASNSTDTADNTGDIEEASGDNGSTGDSAPSATEGEIGATLNSGQADITVSNLRASSDVIGSYVCVDVNLVNTDDENLSVSPLSDLKLTDPNSVSSSPTFGGETTNIESVDVGAGGNRQFTSCFNGDGTPGTYKVVYEKMFSFQSKTVTWNGAL